MENSRHLISVVIPCYNQAQYLPEALSSVLSQTYPDWECIIINDGSLDDTEAVSKAWASKDERFKYLKKENGGLGSARNVGLKSARGKCIQFLDADDVIHPDKFALQIKTLENTGEDAISISSYFASTETNLNQPYTSWYLDPRFRTHNFLHEIITDWESRLSIPVHCFLFKSAIFKVHNILFNEHLPNHEDWECWMNIFRLNPEVKYIDAKLATYRIRTGSMVRDIRLMEKGFLQAIDIQKNKFDENSIEHDLLVKRYNRVKYGFSTRNPFLIYFGMLTKKPRRLVAPIYRHILRMIVNPQKLNSR
jgi:glycosyltransferase involved in cell wall biosynthesis